MPESGANAERSGKWEVVHLGRDKNIRPFNLDPSGRQWFQCVCCGEYTLDVVDECDICSNCGWEDWYQCHDEPDQRISPNGISLNAAKAICAKFGPGACCEANWVLGSNRLHELDAMKPDEIKRLKTAKERVEGH